ncbi:HEPN domain-containing protein [Pantoea ananatis]|uniref:HEPN domain-containing protein n=1 Tax=Pantoea ananas TaxID=553 RepID=UPI001B30458B|nr:HEPN domain-containing protein [Pantoea ananatis]
MYDSGFVVITSNLIIDDECLPFKVSDTISLSRGTELERDSFQKVINDAGYFGKLVLLPGAEKEVSQQDGSVSWKNNKSFIPYVFTYKNFNHLVPELELAGTLMQPKLLCGMQAAYYDKNHDSVSYSTLISSENIHWMGEQAKNPPKTYQKVDLDDFSKVFNIIISLPLDNHYKRILELYKSTMLIIKNTSLLTLSYFSILEALLTSQDGLSITKQLERKINLIFNINGEVESVPYFGSISSKKLWANLYGLRSDIAHGNSYTIDSTLKSFENVNDYLDLVVVKILRFSLNNQQLVEDLKAC